MWHWLVQQGLYKDLVSWGVGILMGSLLGFALGWKTKFGSRLRQLSSLLDTNTKGGLGDLVEALSENSEALKEKDANSKK